MTTPPNRLLIALLAGSLLAGVVGAALAHDHHHCPKGYVMTHDHKCVKAPK